MELYSTLLLVILSFILFVYWSFKRSYLYFERNGIPFIKPTFPFGNLTDVVFLRKSLVEAYRDIYHQLEPHKFGGIFLAKKKAFMIRDPELIRNILNKDFEYFYDQGVQIDTDAEPFERHLSNMKGSEWKNLRTIFSNTLTTGKMKFMFPLVNECGKKMNNLLNQYTAEESFDVKELIGRFSTDALGGCAFGVEPNALDDPNCEFVQMAKKIFTFRYQAFIRDLWLNMPPILIKTFKLSRMHPEVATFVKDVVDKTIKYREDNNVTRNDYLDLLIALKKATASEQSGNKEQTQDTPKCTTRVSDNLTKIEKITNEMITVQSLVFFAAGYLAPSNAMSFIMLELARNEDIQNKLRHEIRSVLEKNNNELTYDALNEMTYMNMVMDEGLRKYPVSGRISRQATKSYKIPGTETVIPKGTDIVISIYGIHSDPKYYDNPEQFRPERFTEQEKATRPHATYIPFSEGPRACVAKRFAKMQMKIGLVHLLKNFSYRLSPKMKLPLKFTKMFGTLSLQDGVWLQCEKL